MKYKAEITCVYGSERASKSIAEAVSPDNLQAPPGMKISTEAVGKRVKTKIEFDGRIETLLSTLDDLLACTQAAESILS
jgi:hypothetical protein